MITPDEIKVKLKERAQELGFDGFGVCSTLDFSEDAAARLRRWLDAGMFDKMRYLERAFEKKISPRKYFPEARSAVCVCVNFYRPSPERRIALYAQSKDYHDVIKPKLLELSALLETYGGSQKVGVDADPLWEKMLAARAGLGWIGKNTLVVRRLNGAWSFIGVVLTSLELPFDTPAIFSCGSCTKCVDACPTGALGAFGVDTRKCISNLTIERRDSLSENESRLVGDKIFGCDICLRACPLGTDAPLTSTPEFNATICLSKSPSIDEIKTVVSDTPMRRKFGEINV